MRTLECPNCGEVFSKKDVRRHLEKWGYTECQRCFTELKADDFHEYYPILEEAD